MNQPRLPGFTAEASLEKKGGHYEFPAGHRAGAPTGGVSPACRLCYHPLIGVYCCG